MSRKLNDAAKVINLFTNLSDEAKVIVFDVIRSQTQKPRRSKKSKKSEQQTLTEANHATAATN